MRRCQKIPAGVHWAAISPPLRLRRFASEEPNNHSIVFLLRSLRQSMVLKDVRNRSGGITKHNSKYVFNISDLVYWKTCCVIYVNGY